MLWALKPMLDLVKQRRRIREAHAKAKALWDYHGSYQQREQILELIGISDVTDRTLLLTKYWEQLPTPVRSAIGKTFCTQLPPPPQPKQADSKSRAAGAG